MSCFQHFFHPCPPKLYANPAGVVDEELNPDSVNPVTNAALCRKFAEVDEQIGVAITTANTASVTAIAAQERLQSLVENDIQPLKDTVAGLVGGDATGAIQNAINAANDATNAANSAKDAAGKATIAANNATNAANAATQEVGELRTYAEGVNGLANAADQKGTDALTAITNDLRPRMTTAENQIDRITEQITGIVGDVGTLNTNVANLTTRVGTAETAVDNINNHLNTLSGRVENNETAVNNINGYLNGIGDRVTELETHPVPAVYITGRQKRDIHAFDGANVDGSPRSITYLTEYSDGSRVIRCKLTGLTIDASQVPPTDPVAVDVKAQIIRGSADYSLSGMFCSAPNLQTTVTGPHGFANGGTVKILSVDSGAQGTIFNLRVSIIPVYRNAGIYEVGDITFEIVMYKDGVY